MIVIMVIISKMPTLPTLCITILSGAIQGNS